MSILQKDRKLLDEVRNVMSRHRYSIHDNICLFFLCPGDDLFHIGHVEMIGAEIAC